MYMLFLMYNSGEWYFFLKKEGYIYNNNLIIFFFFFFLCTIFLIYPVKTSTKTVQAPATPAQTAAEIPATRGPIHIHNHINKMNLHYI
jgi:hypothetical protein